MTINNGVETIDVSSLSSRMVLRGIRHVMDDAVKQAKRQGLVTDAVEWDERLDRTRGGRPARRYVFGIGTPLRATWVVSYDAYGRVIEFPTMEHTHPDPYANVDGYTRLRTRLRDNFRYGMPGIIKLVDKYGVRGLIW